jgi:hypothetical protein
MLWTGVQMLGLARRTKRGSLTKYSSKFLSQSGEAGADYGSESSSAPLSPFGRGAGGEGVQWHYLYIPQGVFERMAGDTIAELARACVPALQNLLQSEEFQDLPLFVNLGQVDEAASPVDSLIDPSHSQCAASPLSLCRRPSRDALPLLSKAKRE